MIVMNIYEKKGKKENKNTTHERIRITIRTTMTTIINANTLTIYMMTLLSSPLLSHSSKQKKKKKKNCNTLTELLNTSFHLK